MMSAMRPFTRRSLLASALAPVALSAAGRAELHFQPNRGQFKSGAFGSDQPRWQGMFSAGRVRLEAKRLLADPGPEVYAKVMEQRRPKLVHLDLTLVGGRSVEPVGEDLRPGRSDYFFHGDEKTFVRKLPHYYRLRYAEVWPGIDLVFRAWEGLVELEPVIRPGADIALLATSWRGASAGRDSGGAVRLATSWGTVRQRAPRDLRGRYVLDGDALRFLVA